MKTRNMVIGFMFCCATVVSPQLADAKAKLDFRTAKTLAELDKLGAKPLEGAAVTSAVSGKTFKTKGWTWTMNADGTQASKASDNSWTDSGTWQVRGNQFCRQSAATKGAELCSTVFASGKDLRMSDPAATGKLTAWTLSY